MKNTGVEYLKDVNVQKVISLYNELGGTGELIDILANLYDFPGSGKLFQKIAGKLREAKELIDYPS